MLNKIYSILQRVGHSFMLPVAVLPVAGLLLGIGNSFTNETTIHAYNMEWILGKGTVLNSILTVFSISGKMIFDNLPIIFAVGVAIGMARKQKEVSALSAMIAFLTMNAAINAVLVIRGFINADGTISNNVMSGMITDVVGIKTLQMGVFGGILIGLIVANLHNRFYTIELPSAISFFGGIRFVPIISVFAAVITGMIMSFIWPVIQGGIHTLGILIADAGLAGTFLYGLIKRALIPFGLHHVFYLPFWQTALGGTMKISGEMVSGAQNIFFAQLADPSTTHFSVEACRFFSGEFIFMIFGLPGAALAMYQCARPEKKKVVGALMFSAALTSMLTGITEPVEFSFIFVAPILFGVQVFLAATTYMVAQIFKIAIGVTFSAGFLDFFIFGVLQGNAKTNWIMVLPLGIVYFLLYYNIFRILILKLDLKTPGREDAGEAVKVYTKSDVHHQKKVVESLKKPIKNMDQIVKIARALGGRDNIIDTDCCATRLRCTLKDPKLVSDVLIQETGSRGILKKGNSIQIIYGPNVTIIKSGLDSFIESDYPETIETIDMSRQEKEVKKEEYVISPINGKLITLEEVGDTVFSAKMLGDGFGIIPKEGKIHAPFTGKISAVFDTKHAIGFVDEWGTEVLVHVGINTVQLNGKYFNILVEPGQEVTEGELVGTFDMLGIATNGYSIVTPVVVVNKDEKKELTIDLNAKHVITLTDL